MRTVETIAQLDDLPVGTVIRTVEGAEVYQSTRRPANRTPGSSTWEETGVEGSSYALSIALPARVLYDPREDGS